MSEQNQAVARRWLEEAWNLGSVGVLDEICADDYIEYDPAYPGGRLPREGVKQAIPVARSAFPDLTFVIKDMVAEGDKVAVYWTATGTFLGPVNGLPPTGKRGEIDCMTLIRLRDGKAIEARSCWDLADWRQQVGLPQRPPEGGTP